MRAQPKYCPTCRAASFNSSAGDQGKSCTAGNLTGGWKLRTMRWQFAVPIVLIPIILLLLCAYFTTGLRQEDGVGEENASTSPEAEGENTADLIPSKQSEDGFDKQTDFLSDFETSFAPQNPNVHFLKTATRSKRESILIARYKQTVSGGPGLGGSNPVGSDPVGSVSTLQPLKLKTSVVNADVHPDEGARVTHIDASTNNVVTPIADSNDYIEVDLIRVQEDTVQINETEEIVWIVPDSQRVTSLKLDNEIAAQKSTHRSTRQESSGTRDRESLNATAYDEIDEKHQNHENLLIVQHHPLLTSASGNASLEASTSEGDSKQTLEWSISNDANDSASVTAENGSALHGTWNPATHDGVNFQLFWGRHADERLIRETQARTMQAHMDQTADPCHDFYQYACGNWEAHNPIPKDKGAYDTFEMLRESLDAALKEMLEETPQSDDDNDAWTKARNLFQSCMDYEILEEHGETPLRDLLQSLGNWPILDPSWNASSFDWLILVAKLRLYNNDILLSQWVGPDIKNSNEYIIQFDQTTLGLPTRDYFLHQSNRKFVEAYKSYMINIALLLGVPQDRASRQATEIIEFETLLAGITSAPEQRRNVSELYHRTTVGELRQWIPQIDWFAYLSVVLAKPVAADQPVVIFAVKYVQDLISLIEKTPPSTVSNYLLWRFVRHRVSNLDDRFLAAKQRFYRVLFGREQAPKRWKACVNQVNSNMGMALGAMFVHKYFDQYSKTDTLEMTEAITNSFRDLLLNLTWISTETKNIALLKIEAMLLRIGYPEFIVNKEALNERYENVVIKPDAYFENTLNILMHLTRMEQDRIGSVVNKTQWNTAPAVVNAYYSRNKNQIIFPAGILQPPFYHRLFPKSLNYGGIGVVIGHEITHGFDDKGRLFDHHGNLKRWWDDAAIETFHTRAQCLIDQYSQFIVRGINMPVDGLNTQGENIADNGGIKQAYIAYHKWLDANGNYDERLPGMNATNDQLFFLNFAQVWCGSTRPETARNKLKTTVHAPGKFRVIGTLSNSQEFSQAFNCPVGSNMNPEKKCSVW